MNKIYYPYRFRTEEEFIERFGSDWYANIVYTWNFEMDCYLGKDLEITDKNFLHEIIEMANTGYTMKNFYHSWWLSSDMIVKNMSRIPSYKPKKIDRKI